MKKVLWPFQTDLCAILTINAQMAGYWDHYPQESLSHADYIHEFMIKVMKEEQHRLGVWMWRINKTTDTIIGEFLGWQNDAVDDLQYL